MTSNEILEIAQNLNSLKPLKKEQILLNSTKENPKIFSKINDLINEYNDITINLPIMKLLAPSKLSRAKKTPRPQNLFILYRRNLSKGLCKINPKSVGKSSQVASLLWKSISEREREFWRQLSIIAKEKHNTIYSDYKYEPNKKKKRNRYKVSSKKINRKDNPQIFINTLPDLSPYVNEPSTTILKNEQIHSLTQNLAQNMLPSVPSQQQHPQYPQHPYPQPYPQLQQQQPIDPCYVPIELPHYYYQPALTVIPTIPTISHPQFVITSPTVGNELYNTSYDLSSSVNPDPLLLNLLNYDDSFNYNYYYYYS
ncbi:hypothetical protein RhiirA5_497665 [Rhizophagus irregularis]|uniref:HMG box domain-containing protein n=3 Tax=Rhizophagus irregularis TaxID=588596 RepID=A0A2I1E654_9GLOM|nr:hypothetical protein GLOIN_2v1770538 [Rhizophagus irregularis DAOM 181602=DAOM 197198]EXX69522.1 hypothetical protein RirG_095330 [Rhizophagus irregularis DAOM 197198w]PKC11449.1 hypothetical protein RhiirA5_497665 [Rhizophagus irregularis]EXX78891.1 hypothetical protein RirG_010850 [Rhizophagus irregularis DAOM 197198w]EXX79665.1 hypothetical protein RirG_003410 [Rhizophagus irregularis DAOM 197198w]PKC68345.1 hypothetical protein RhiirA1_534255 [Rhizophagus irregularis]|eukprot:XP_025182029.1 hypothetical protein GLOIN_2v1770538 [Rhizophagus irregularis DAOM 181602=DAOM 197198]